MDPDTLRKDIFSIRDDNQFNKIALQVFTYQYQNNSIYRQFCDALSTPPEAIHHYNQIPFLPIEFFKQHKITSGGKASLITFTSSGTTGAQSSTHYVCEPELYEMSFIKSFELFIGHPDEYHILALLPAYLEREGSSLIYMVNKLISLSKSKHSGFYLNNYKALHEKIVELTAHSRKVLLIGVSFALLDFAEQFPGKYPNLQIMETGGMKGRRKELLREELHDILIKAFGNKKILSEYGMTELLSQAYSLGDGIFSTPPFMKVLIKDSNDPLSNVAKNITGNICVIDLANLYSCSFIYTQDLGQLVSDNEFKVLGRYDHSDVRGCNLMVD